MQLQRHNLQKTNPFIILALMLLTSIVALIRSTTAAEQLPPFSPFHTGAAGFERGYLASLSQPNPNPYLTMHNPADVYCVEMGYRYQVLTQPDGSQTSICLLPDKSTCPSWDFLNGKCGQAYSYCAQNGMSTLTKNDGNNPFTPEYAVCVDENGIQRGAVSELSGLLEEASGRTAEDWLTSLAAPTFAAPEAAAEVSEPLAALDWRNNNGDWMTPVKNQGICGSCWAFSAVGVAEVATNRAANNPALDPDLSEQYLVTDCSSAGACDGGWENLALGYIRDYGIPDEACLPYNDGLSTGCTYISSTGACDSNVTDSGYCTYHTGGECSDYQCSDRCSNWESRLTRIAAYASVGTSQTAIKQALVDHGPLTVAMNMNGSFSGGIYRCTNTSPNHAVVLAGYNDSGSYWIVKNSWGTNWNPSESGYFKVGYDQCGIQNYANYATGIAPSNPVPSLSSLDPSSTDAGGSAFTLTVYGTNFKNGVSTVRWNGSNRATTFISSTQLQASILASDIASPGTASVTVFNSSPGGGTSNALGFSILAPFKNFVPFLLSAGQPAVGLVNGDFESGADVGWAEYSSGGYENILSLDDLPSAIGTHAGNWATWLGGDDNETGRISQEVTIPSSGPYLVFWYWIDSSEDWCGWDFAYVVVDGSIVETYDLCDSYETGGWVQDSLDLSSYAGMNVTLKFQVETDISNISSFFLDDVMFSSTGLVAGETGSSTPAVEVNPAVKREP